MSNLQKRYDELDDIIRRVGMLIDDITNEDYKIQLEEIKFQAERELEEVEPQLQEQRDAEERAYELAYERSCI